MTGLAGQLWYGWLWPAVVLAGVLVAFVLIFHRFLLASARNSEKKTGTHIYAALVLRSRAPIASLFLLVIVLAILPVLPVGPTLMEGLRHAVVIGLIAAAGWLTIRLLHSLQDVIAAQYELDRQDNLKARKIRTQTQMLHRVSVVVVIIITLSLILMTFSSVRNIGAALLASAGLAGIVAGVAARPLVTNLIAGVQIALTEPIRLDDVVIVEGEWGWIEEIGTTYVVVRIWDLRRLVLPLSYFLEKPFQNWTRVTADLLGTVFIYTDYTVPVEEIRQELHRVLATSALWDGKTWGLQVTNATEHVMELRALMSAPGSGQAWDLRCHVREKLIGFLQERYPQRLPRTRVQLQSGLSEQEGSTGNASSEPAQGA